MSFLPHRKRAGTQESGKRKEKGISTGEVWFHFFRGCAERISGYVGGSGRKWAELVRISTWLHAEHVEVGAEMKQVAPRSKYCNQPPAMQFLPAEHAYYGSTVERDG